MADKMKHPLEDRVDTAPDVPGKSAAENAAPLEHAAGDGHSPNRTMSSRGTKIARPAHRIVSQRRRKTARFSKASAEPNYRFDPSVLRHILTPNWARIIFCIYVIRTRKPHQSPQTYAWFYCTCSNIWLRL